MTSIQKDLQYGILSTHTNISILRLPIVIGIVCDGLRDTSFFSLRKYEEFNIFFPPKEHYTSDTLPEE